MNLTRMSKKEYEKFRLIINILVFIAFLLAFIFIQLRQLSQQDLLSTLLAVIVLSSMFLMLGVLTVIPYYAVYIGRTFIVFSILMSAAELYLISKTSFAIDIFSIAKFILAVVMFLYGLELKSKEKKLISLKVLTKN